MLFKNRLGLRVELLLVISPFQEHHGECHLSCAGSALPWLLPQDLIPASCFGTYGTQKIRLYARCWLAHTHCGAASVWAAVTPFARRNIPGTQAYLLRLLSTIACSGILGRMVLRFDTEVTRI